jgi:hypothetical protein
MPSSIGGNYTHLNANGTVTIQAQILVGVIFNTKGAAANVLTLRDGSASGTIIAVIDTTAPTAGWLHYGAQLLGGALIAVLATGTAADVTIITN